MHPSRSVLSQQQRIRHYAQASDAFCFFKQLTSPELFDALEAAAVQDEQVLVQGIADLVLVFPDHLELLDYKTDRRKTEADFLSAYRPQLNLYALAIDKRFAPKKVTYKGIYSLELGKLIEVK